MSTTPIKQIKRIVGEIISHKTDKTAIVRVTSVKTHPKYHKRFTRVKKYMAHDAQNSFRVGDRVELIPCRPYSRMKKFMITRKLI